MTDASIDPTALRIVAGHLVEDTGECNCSGPDVGTQHEPGCGLWPLMTVGELAGLISGPDPEGVGEVTANGLTIYGRIANPDGTEIRAQQSAVDGCDPADVRVGPVDFGADHDHRDSVRP
jgi:hypothetical protein